MFVLKDRFGTPKARRRRKYRYYRELAFLRPVLASRATWSSTLQPVPGAVLHRSTSDPSQPSDSQEASCRSATQTAGDQEAGPSGVPLSQVSVSGYAGTTRQRQRASDRPVMPEFMLLSEAFKGSLKALSARMESVFSLMERGFNHMEHRFHSVDQRLDRMEADLNRPAHHFFSKIEQGMAEHLSPEQQLSVLQACNTAYLQAMQQNRYVQQSVVSFPTVPPLTRFTTLPTSAAYQCTATCIPSEAGHHYTTPSLSAAGHSTATTTMSSAAPVWSTTTAKAPPAWSQTTTEPAWATHTTSQHQRSTASTPQEQSTASTPQQQSTASTPKQKSTASTPKQQSTASTPKQQSTASTPKQQSTASTPKQQSTASTPKQQSTASTPKQQSTASTPKQQSTASTLHLRSTGSTPHQRSTTTTPH
ncbi:uncharacterized protein [Dendrobates tinctorius]|uniref:uncharacterized protein n=1 Tax=Dendrobates tinctorius TaxID=92724 RepID=UPI003CC9CE43